MATSEDRWKPSSYPPSETALLLLDYENAHVNLIQNSEEREKVIRSTKRLLKTAREKNVAIVHCLMDTTRDPPLTSKGNEKWHSMIKPLFAGNPDMVAEYSELAATAHSDNTRERTSHRNPAHTSAFVTTGLLQLLRDNLGVKHLIMSGIPTSNSVLGTATHALNLDFVVTVVEEACWDPNKEVHRTLLDTVLPVLAWVSTVDEAVGHMTA